MNTHAKDEPFVDYDIADLLTKIQNFQFPPMEAESDLKVESGLTFSSWLTESIFREPFTRRMFPKTIALGFLVGGAIWFFWSSSIIALIFIAISLVAYVYGVIIGFYEDAKNAPKGPLGIIITNLEKDKELLSVLSSCRLGKLRYAQLKIKDVSKAVAAKNDIVSLIINIGSGVGVLLVSLYSLGIFGNSSSPSPAENFIKTLLVVVAAVAGIILKCIKNVANKKLLLLNEAEFYIKTTLFSSSKKAS